MAGIPDTKRINLSSASFSAEDILAFLIQSGKIDLDDAEDNMKII